MNTAPHATTRRFSRLLFLALPLAGMVLAPGLAAPPTAAAAEIRYAKPVITVPLREKDTPRSKVLVEVNLAEPLEVLRETREWARVKTANNVTGWVPVKYLGAAPIVPGEYFKEGSAAGQALVDADRVFKELNAENAKLKQDLAVCSGDLDTVQGKFDAMNQDPDSIVHIKSALEDTQAKLKDQEERRRQWEDDYIALKRQQNILWFLAGAGALFLGWLIGRFSRGRRQSRLY